MGKLGWSFYERTLDQLIEDQKRDEERLPEAEEEHRSYIKMLHDHGEDPKERDWNPRNDLWISLDDCIRKMQSTGDTYRNLKKLVSMRGSYIDYLRYRFHEVP